MIITTTNYCEGKNIKEYKGIVFGEVITGIRYTKDFSASITNFIGGRVQEYEDELIDARAAAIQEMMERAKKGGANAVIGVKVDTEAIGRESSMIMVTVSGTAVIIE